MTPPHADPQREKRVDLILAQLEGLPTLPTVVVQVLAAMTSDDSSAADVARLIESDPALSTRVLQLVRSADVNLNVPSVSRAIVVLGFDAVRNAVLATGVFDALAAGGNGTRSTPFSRDDFWKHSLAVACCAELLGEAAVATWGRDAGIAPGEAFLCGLLHDVGKVALDVLFPKSFARVIEAAELLRGNVADVERSVIGIDHAVAGKRLAEQWGLPPSVRDVAWLHNQHPQSLANVTPFGRLVNVVTLADALVREQHLGFSGNYAFPVPRPQLLEALALPASAVEQVMAALVDRVAPRAAALGLGQQPAHELYRQAIARANQELGRAAGQLRAKNRKLSIRARCFEALARFHDDIRPDATPAAVLQAIGQTAQGFVGQRAIAAFSLVAGHKYAEAVVVNPAGERVETTLIDYPVPPATPAPDTPFAARWGDVVPSSSADDLTGPADDVNGTKDEAGASPVRSDRNGPPARQTIVSSTNTILLPRAGEGPVLAAGGELEWLLAPLSPRLEGERHYWLCLQTDARCVGGVVWAGPPGDADRLTPQAPELVAITNGWALALRAAQVREENRTLAEQLVEANQLLQSARGEVNTSRMMRTVGEMAAGAAHEMNNPLAVISGRSQLLASQLSDPRQKHAASQIYDQSHRLSEIITELMNFARPEPARPVECDLADLVGRAIHEAKSGDELADTSFEVTCADVPPVLVDADQVGQAISEVLGNAVQATEACTNGSIVIHAAHDPYGNRVVLTISDNGCGMEADTLGRAFDPFYSSRPAGRRRGMGLAKALRWVEGSGGTLRLESKPGQGTRTTFVLPAIPVAAATDGPIATTTAMPQADEPRRLRSA